jgi:RNA exonuclease 1
MGTMKVSRIATEKAEKEALSRLTRDRIERYLLPVDEFEKWRYPNPSNDSLVNPPISEPDAEGTEQKCSRCKIDFTVSSKHLKERAKEGECHFHHGRLAPERIEGIRKWIYSCCKRERGEEGCEIGVHVFNHGDDDELLAKRVSYVRVGRGVDEKNKGGAEVLGMDCEMICECDDFGKRG